MFGTKHSKTNQLQKTIQYKTNEQSTKCLKWNMQIESQVRLVFAVFASTCCLY